MPETIYVQLVNEHVDVWRPVAATLEREAAYRLPDAAPGDEEWAYPPGALVRVERSELSDGPALVVTGLAE